MGKGVSWHNTQFCDLKNTKAIRQDHWKPIMNGKRNSTPAIPTLTPAGASTISTLLSRRAGTTTSFKAALNRLAACRTRRDSTRFVDTLITASPDFFKKKSPKEIQDFFQRAADFLIGRVGKENIVSAVVHMDEKTPHLHLVFVPLTEDNRLCAKEIIGNRANLTKWQDDFHAYMVEKYPDLERGESASKTGRKHIPTRLFKQAVNLSKQARAIEATLDGITPFNAGKKKEEALSLLKKWFPQMENFSGQLKKYKVTINDLLAENEQLEARAKASEKGKMKDTMERAKLESDLKDIQRLVDRIPPEVLAELKRQPNKRGREL